MRSRVPIPTRATNGHARNGRAHDGPSATVCDGAAGTAPPPAEPAPNAERTANGQFARGNKCSLGNPFARRLGALRSAFLNAVTEPDVATVARKLADLAAAGDVQAAALFLSYAVGKPLPSVDPDRLDLDEFAIADAAPTKSRASAVIFGAIAPGIAAALARMATPADQAEALAALKKMSMRELKAIMGEQDARIGRPAE